MLTSLESPPRAARPCILFLEFRSTLSSLPDDEILESRSFREISRVLAITKFEMCIFYGCRQRNSARRGGRPTVHSRGTPTHPRTRIRVECAVQVIMQPGSNGGRHLLERGATRPSLGCCLPTLRHLQILQRASTPYLPHAPCATPPSHSTNVHQEVK